MLLDAFGSQLFIYQITEITGRGKYIATTRDSMSSTTSYCFLLKDGDFLAKTSHSCVIDERSLSKCPAI